MYRNIKEKLICWKNSSIRKPLLLSGARQTGKTYIIDEFGKSWRGGLKSFVIFSNFLRNIDQAIYNIGNR